jgi:hypothetical protein
MGNTPQPPPILLRNWLTTRPTEHCSKTADGNISAENRSLKWCLSSPLVLIENWPAFLRKRCHPPCQSGVIERVFEACFSSSIDWLRVCRVGVEHRIQSAFHCQPDLRCQFLIKRLVPTPYSVPRARVRDQTDAKRVDTIDFPGSENHIQRVLGSHHPWQPG